MSSFNSLVLLTLQSIGLSSFDQSYDDITSFNSMKSCVKAAKPELYNDNNAILVAEVSSWISFAVKISSSSSSSCHDEMIMSLDHILGKKSFLVGSHVSLADHIVFASVYHYVDASKWRSIARWMDMMHHVQASSSPLISKASYPKQATVHYIIPAAAQPSSTCSSSASATSTSSSAADVAQESSAVAASSKKSDAKKEKASSSSSSAAAAAPTIDEDLDPSKLDIRIGRVVRCWDHPDSDKLLCEEIDVGDVVDGAPATRTIASGLRAFYSASDVEGKFVVVLSNLKERAMAGFKSQGMVLCASNADHTAVKLLTPPMSAKVGDRVKFDGYDGEPAAPNQLAKKKIFEKLAPMLRTDAAGVAHWNDKAFKIGDEVVTGTLPNAVVA